MQGWALAAPALEGSSKTPQWGGGGLLHNSKMRVDIVLVCGAAQSGHNTPYRNVVVAVKALQRLIRVHFVPAGPCGRHVRATNIFRCRPLWQILLKNGQDLNRERFDNGLEQNEIKSINSEQVDFFKKANASTGNGGLWRICKTLVRHMHWFAASADERREETSFNAKHIFPLGNKCLQSQIKSKTVIERWLEAMKWIHHMHSK